MTEPSSPSSTNTGFDARDNAGQDMAPPHPPPVPPTQEVEERGEVPFVTFVFTDIEDSTGHWQRLPLGMRHAQKQHDDLMRQAFERFGGRVFRTVGDAFCVAFNDPSAAVQAALEAQVKLQTVFVDDAEESLLRVRFALHTGLAEPLDDDYYGLAPARTARVLEGIRGGQVLLTADTALLVQGNLPPDASLTDLGPCRLRSFEEVEHLFQLHHPGLPLIVTPPRSAVSVPNNLPRQVTPFFGREAEIAEARRRLSLYNLVTLVGMGGCGKTRLALRLTDFVYSDFPDGIYFADLSGQRDDRQVAQAVALTLGVKLDGALPVLEQVTTFLREKNLLLILDNCEQVIEGACELADAILQQAPCVRMIATSREGLGVLGESLLPVNPFPIPDTPNYPQLLKSESVRLFAERAASQSPRFQITPENAFAVASVCRRVEGIPLGLVLTAAWSNEYSPEQIANQLEARFTRLTTGRIRSLPARHRTLYATVDWGYDLLSREEQTLLRRVALFRGGFTPEAAQAVCGEGITDVFAALATLCRKSLLIAEPTPTPATIRYRTLEPVHDYAEERLRENGEWDSLETAHRQYFVQWAEAIAPRVIAPDARVALEEIDTEQENLQAALMSADGAHDDEAGVQLIASLYWHWHVRGDVQQGRAWVSRFLAENTSHSDPVTWMKALNGAGVIASDTHDYNTALHFYQLALQATRDNNDREREAGSLNNVGIVLSKLDRHKEAEAHYQESLGIYQADNNVFRMASVYNSLGLQADATEDYANAEYYHISALEIQRKFPPSPSLGVTLLNLTLLSIKQKRWQAAFDYIHESFTVRRALRNSLGMLRVLDCLPSVMFSLGRIEDAATVLGAAKAFRDQIGINTDAEATMILDDARQKISDNLGEDYTTRKEYTGSLLNLDEVAKIAFKEEVS